MVLKYNILETTISDLITDLYVKPTDMHQYLHASSSNKICSEPAFRCNQLEEWLDKGLQTENGTRSGLESTKTEA